MPRIFDVIFTKEFSTTIVAESADEIQASLDKCTDSDFDDWSDVSWETNICDRLANIRKPERVPTEFKEPDMGVANGEAVNIYDYRKVHPDYMAGLLADAAEYARKLQETQAKIQAALEEFPDTK